MGWLDRVRRARAKSANASGAAAEQRQQPDAAPSAGQRVASFVEAALADVATLVSDPANRQRAGRVVGVIVDKAAQLPAERVAWHLTQWALCGVYAFAEKVAAELSAELEAQQKAG